MSQDFETLLSIIKKPVNKRSHSDISLLASLLDSIKFFKERKLSLKDLHYVAKYLTYVFFKEGECIIRYHELGDTFFIILKGSVSVIVPIKIPNEQGNIETVFKDVATLDSGKSFGELALINNKPRFVVCISIRTATILSKEPTHLACMDRTSYEKVLKVIEEKALRELLDFLHSLPLFTGWTNTALTKLKFFFFPKKFARNGVVYEEGNPSGKVYIVRKGEFQESCKVALNDGIHDEDCLPILSEEKKKFCTFRHNFISKKIISCPIYIRNADVMLNFYSIDSYCYCR